MYLHDPWQMYSSIKAKKKAEQHCGHCEHDGEADCTLNVLC